MDFVFDVAELAPGLGKSIGIYNYAVNLFHHMLPRLGNGLHLHVACNRGGAVDFDPMGHPGVTQHIVLHDDKPGARDRQVWLRFGAQAFARRIGARHYFSPKGFIPGWFGPSCGLRTVAVLHDLIPLWYSEHHPGYFGRLESVVVNNALLRTARHADELIVISQATAQDVLSRVARPLGHTHVIYNGVPFKASDPVHPLGGRPYIFAVSSALPHKNAAVLLAAYQRYRARTPDPLPLVVCGIDDPKAHGVVAVKGISDVALHTYYAHAELFVFLSLMEGFGFPPLEALSHRAKVLCSDIPVMREVTAGGARLVNPHDVERIAECMSDLLSVAATERVGQDSAVEVAARFDWDRCANDVVSVLAGMPRA
jgi:glycosyltransferase involved in cell wall biosynthesis